MSISIISQPKKLAELERILREEDYKLLLGNTSQIPFDLPKERPIMVCGAYREICVWQVWKSLVDEGYNTSIYEPASFNIVKLDNINLDHVS